MFKDSDTRKETKLNNIFIYIYIYTGNDENYNSLLVEIVSTRCATRREAVVSISRALVAFHSLLQAAKRIFKSSVDAF